MNFVTVSMAIVRDLCRLRRGPQDLPYAPRLLAGLLILVVAVDLTIGEAVGLPGNLLGRSLLSIVLLLGGSYALLSLRQRSARFVQTVTALVIVGVLFTLLLLPVVLFMGDPPKPPAQLAPRQVLLGWMLLALMVWKLTIDAHIWRHALEIPMGVGVLLAIAFFAIDTLLSRWLFGGAS